MSDLLEKIYSQTTDPSLSISDILNNIKKEFNYYEYSEIFNYYPNLKHQKIHGSRFNKIEQIFQRDPYEFTKNLRKELFWILYNINNNAYQINEFINSKKNFENLFLLNHYDIAEKDLDSIRKAFGENLWTLEMDLLLKEYRFNTSENWTTLSNHINTIKTPFYQFLLNFYSKRIEERMSLENCFTQFENDVAGISDSTVIDFLVFKCLYLAGFNYIHRNYEGVLYATNLFSGVDQYLTTIDVIIKLVLNNNYYDKIILEFLEKLDKKLTNDHRISNIINFIDNKRETIVQKNTEFILPIIDEYSIGNFENCILLCQENLKSNPSIFELYEIYCKSLINRNFEFQPTGISPFIDKILESIYKSLLYNVDSEKYRNDLLKYSLTLSSFDLGKQIAAFVTTLRGNQNSNQSSLISYLSSTINNPRILSIVPEFRKQYIVKKNKIFKHHPSHKNNILINGSIDDCELCQSKDKAQSDIYLAKNLFNQEKYEETIVLLDIYIQKQISPFYYDIVLWILFESYLKTNKLKEALILTATIIVDDDFYTNNLDIQSLTQKIKKAGIHNFAKYIELPIVFKTITKDYDLYDVYIEFMSFYEESYPSKLKIEEIISISSLEKVIFFLKEVCKISTLQYDLEFNSISKVESERIEICNILKKIDKENSLSYENEIHEILRAAAVRKVIKEVDEGRLYVNIEGLKSLQLNNVKESFNRYKEIEVITKDKDLRGFNISKDINWISTNFHQSDIDSGFNNSAFLAFKIIYFDTREKFLFSKEYGLDACLSTNFRHGAIKNHIRSVFERLFLVTSKSENLYSDNIKWFDFNYDSELNLKIQNLLKGFSKDIDDYTTFIIENLIQISTEKNNDKIDALFNFATNDESLLSFWFEHKSRINSYLDILDIIYTNFTNHLLFLVNYIYKKLINEVSQKYVLIIDDLINNIKLLSIGTQNELLSNLSLSKTNIHAELEKISEWFFFNTTNPSSLLEIETLINASVEYTNSINPRKRINPNIDIQCPPYFAFSNLIIVFNILLNNIIEHSKLDNDEIEVAIQIINPLDDLIEIKLINSISTKVDVDNTILKLQKVKDEWNNHINIERTNKEGNSGFDKIKRILLYEALSKSDKFDFTVADYKVSVSLFLPYKIYTSEKDINN